MHGRILEETSSSFYVAVSVCSFEVDTIKTLQDGGLMREELLNQVTQCASRSFVSRLHTVNMVDSNREIGGTNYRIEPRVKPASRVIQMFDICESEPREAELITPLESPKVSNKPVLQPNIFSSQFSSIRRILFH